MYPRLQKNVPGDFYTTGECLSCTLRESEAPSLLAPLDEENSDSYFVRQPATVEETEMACRAALVCCVSRSHEHQEVSPSPSVTVRSPCAPSTI